MATTKQRAVYAAPKPQKSADDLLKELAAINTREAQITTQMRKLRDGQSDLAIKKAQLLTELVERGIISLPEGEY